MPTPIVWSPRAYDKYLELLKFWHDQSLDYALKLDDAVEKLLLNLEQFKNMCPPATKRPLFRKCTVLKRYALIYRNDQDMIWIVDILDNRKQKG
jgi:plasmid stabilization system protein ParE